MSIEVPLVLSFILLLLFSLGEETSILFHWEMELQKGENPTTYSRLQKWSPRSNH